MKITAALAAIAAVAFAPLAAAQISCINPANTALMQQLTVTSTIKRTTVTGGAKLAHVITIKNGGGNAVPSLQFNTDIDADLTFQKARLNAVHKGVAKPTVTLVAGDPTASAFTLPAGKTLKATLTYKTKTCPTLTNPHTVLVNVGITNGGPQCLIQKSNTVRAWCIVCACIQTNSTHVAQACVLPACLPDSEPDPSLRDPNRPTPKLTGHDQQEEDLPLST